MRPAPATAPRTRASHCCLILLVLGSTLLSQLGTSDASQCYYPYVPRPLESSQEIREQLEADGLWHPSRTAGETPPINPQVGDTWDWYIWDLSGFPTATLKPCTVRGMGANSYIVVDDDEWNVSINQTDVDRIVTFFEEQSLGSFPDQGIWELDTSHFGDPPDPLDGLPRIFLLYYRFNIAADGFFWIYDQFPDGTQAFASNEADVVYLATDSSGGGPSTNYMLAVAAHEFQHMIHYNYDTNEDIWVEEGLSELAMWLFGHPDAISAFNSNPDNSLIVWGAEWADYIQTYLWTLYAYEQYGGQPTIWDLVHLPANGMAGYLAALTGQGYAVTMEDVFGDWSVANYLDDTAVPAGQFGYTGDDLPPFVALPHPLELSGRRDRQRPELGDRLHPPDRLRRGADADLRRRRQPRLPGVADGARPVAADAGGVAGARCREQRPVRVQRGRRLRRGDRLGGQRLPVDQRDLQLLRRRRDVGDPAVRGWLRVGRHVSLERDRALEVHAASALRVAVFDREMLLDGHCGANFSMR